MLHTLANRNTQSLYTKSTLAIISALLLTLLLSTTPAMADTLADLRASGAIGESVTGYVVARDAGARTSANNINVKRKAVYAQKAGSQGVSIEQVGRVYAAEILKKIPAGTWIQNDNGQWSQK